MIKNYAEISKEYRILKTDRLILRPYSIDDKEALLDYSSDKEVLKYLVFDGLYSLEDAEKSIIEYYGSNPFAYAIELAEEGKCIGGIEFRVDEENDKANYGCIMNKNYWNNGYMTEALSEMLKLGFDVLKLNRIEGTYFSENVGSGKVMQKCGMKYEGIGRQEIKIRGEFIDHVHYAILMSDWEEMKNK